MIIQAGIRRMVQDGEDIFYYITLTNENYPQPVLPPADREGILRGLYRYAGGADATVQLLGSGAILNEASQARELLRERYGIAAAVWSATSYKALYADACQTQRWNRLHPAETPRTPYLLQCLGATAGPVIAASDYVRALPGCIGAWLGSRLTTLGTDGFGRSDGRAALRRFFGVDAAAIAYTALTALAASGGFDKGRLVEAADALGIDRDAPAPETC